MRRPPAIPTPDDEVHYETASGFYGSQEYESPVHMSAYQEPTSIVSRLIIHHVVSTGKHA